MLLLCDLDGTLVDGQQAFRSWCEVLAERYQQPPEFVDWMLAEERAGAWAQRTLFPSLRDRLGLEAPLEELEVRFSGDFTAQFRCEPSVVEALSLVKSLGHKVAIVTNGAPSQANKIEAAGLTGIADAVCISSLEGVSKPNPELLRIAASRVGGPLEGAWMVGDSQADVRAAVDARVRSVWLSRGVDWTERDYRPTEVATSFPNAVDLVLQSWS